MENKIRLYKNEKVDYILKCLLVLFIIYFGRDTLVISTYIGFVNSYIVMTFVLFLLCLKVLINIFKKKQYENKMIHFIFISIFIIISMIINNAYTLMYFSIIYAIFYSIILTYYFEYHEFLSVYITVMVFLVLYSFFAELCLNNLFINIVMNASSIKFNNMIFCFVPQLTNYVRVFSIFREPGVYSYFLLIGIYFLLFQNNNNINMKSIKLSILILGVFSTFSVTGYICMFLLFCIFLIQNINFKKLLFSISKIIFFVIFSLIIIILIIYINKPLYWMIYSMINKIINLGTDSRINAILYNIHLLLTSPILGNSINLVLSGIDNNTSSIFAIFSTFGLFLGSIFCWLYTIWLNLNFNNYKNVVISIGKILFIFIMLNSQCIITNIFLYVFVIIYYYSYYESNKKRKIDKDLILSLKKRIVHI